MTRALSVLAVFALVGCDALRGSGGAPTPEPAAPPDPPAPALFDSCAQPIATAPCERAQPLYAFDAALKACVELPAGQCPSNTNNFSGPLPCMEKCMQSEAMRAAGERWAHGHTAWGCKVGGTIYGHGTGGIKVAGDCNSCTCAESGHLTCTRMGCPGPICPEGQQVGTSCAVGGAADGCVVVETGCLDTCKTEEDCARKSRSRCVDGLCRNLFP
jgi:hypothetical protein